MRHFPELYYFIAIVVAVIVFSLITLVAVNCGADEIDMSIIAQIESSNNPDAYNVLSKATGIYQMRKIAWIDVQNHYPKLKKYSYKYAFDKTITTIFAEKYFCILHKYMTYYKIPPTTTNYLIAYHDGIGNLRKYLAGKRQLGNEMKGYIGKYILLDKQKLLV